jgi:hypothetical protein
MKSTKDTQLEREGKIIQRLWFEIEVWKKSYWFLATFYLVAFLLIVFSMEIL